MAEQPYQVRQEVISTQNQEVLTGPQKVGKFILKTAGIIAASLGLVVGGFEVPHILNKQINYLDTIPILNNFHLHDIAFNFANFQVEKLYVLETGLLVVFVGSLILNSRIQPLEFAEPVRADTTVSQIEK